jgi:hypothetical protein
LRRTRSPHSSNRRAAERHLSRSDDPLQGLRKEIRHPAHARGHETPFRPDEAHVSPLCYEVLEDRDDVRISEFIGNQKFGEQTNSSPCQNSGTDRLDAVG